MGERPDLSQLTEAIAPRLVSCRSWHDATFISLPMLYPSGSFVTVCLTHARDGIRVSDSGFAYREAESFGAGRSFANTARSIADEIDIKAGKRSIYVDVRPQEVERAIFDVSAASYSVAERIVSRAASEADATISEALHQRLDLLFGSKVEYDKSVKGASTTAWDVTALAKAGGKKAIFQAVVNFPTAVYRTSTAFHDIAALDNPPALISVISSKKEMGSNYSILAQAGRVIEISHPDAAYMRAATL
jgi:hypothetical protein